MPGLEIRVNSATRSRAGRAQGVQTLLNPARKAEQKLQMLHATKARIAAQFNAFLRGLKKSFVKEITKFQSDNAKIAQAIEEAEAEQERTFETVRNAILGGAVEISGNPRQTTPAETMWDQLRNSKKKKASKAVVVREDIVGLSRSQKSRLGPACS